MKLSNAQTPLEQRKLELKAFTESQVFGDWDKEAIRIAEDLHFLIGEVERVIKYVEGGRYISSTAINNTLTQALLKLTQPTDASNAKTQAQGGSNEPVD